MKPIQPWLPIILTGVATFLQLQLGVISTLEPLAQQLLFQARGAQPWHEDIVLVKIDQASISRLGWFPWRRDRYTELLEQLTAAEADTVAFNIIFSEDTVEDATFARAMADHGQVVLAGTWHSDLHPWMPTQTLAQNAAAIGHITQLDSASPTSPRPYIQGQAALAIATAQTHQLRQGNVQLPNGNIPLLPNWPGPVAQLPQYSFVEVLDKQFPPDIFQDKIVLVGMTAPGFDPISIPFEANKSASGIHLHAAILHSFLQQNLLRPPTKQGWIIGLLLWGVGLRYGLARLGQRAQLGVIFASFCGWLMLAGLALKINLLLPIVLPTVILAMTGCSLLLFNNIQLNQTNHQLRDKATTDSMTQLRNRSFFNDYSAYIWRDCIPSQRPLALILCDVDYFKRYNDHYGHLAGDRCLQEVANSLKGAVYRSSDLVARYGGEEFVVLLPNTTLDDACAVAERIQAQLALRALPHNGSSIKSQVTLSLGVACTMPTRTNSLKTLIEQADQALYQAKAAGRDRYTARTL